MSSLVPERRRQVQTLGAIAAPLAVCAAYYAGALLGLQLRLPPATPSVLWPPNAILAAALLLSETRRWPVLLLSALPAHIAVQMSTDWPPSLILTLFLTNCLEAVIAASGTRLLSDAPQRFDSLRRLVAFLVAAVLAAPLLSSFADAAAVTWFRGENYWLVWRSRLFGNMLSELTVVPAVVGLFCELPRWWRAKTASRVREATAVALGLALTGMLAIHTTLPSVEPLSILASGTPLALQLPFLFWAALRFGPTGAGIALLFTSILSAWGLAHGQGPFASFPAATTVTALTWSLLVVTGTLMCCATLTEERRLTQQALAGRLRFEELLSQLSRSFVQLPSDEMDQAIDGWLRRLGVFLEADCLVLHVVDGKDGELVPAHWWDGPEMRDGTPSITPARFPRAFARDPIVPDRGGGGRRLVPGWRRDGARAAAGAGPALGRGCSHPRGRTADWRPGRRQRPEPRGDLAARPEPAPRWGGPRQRARA